MKPVLTLVLLALALPIEVWANSTGFVFSNSGGTITSNGSMLSLSSAHLSSFAQGSGPAVSGLPQGVIFQGTFSGPAIWTASFNPAGPNGKGDWTYTLMGNVSGVFSNGKHASGNMVLFTFDVPLGRPFKEDVSLDSGTATLTAVPEPGTLGLLGTGLVGIAGLIRHKLKSGV